MTEKTEDRWNEILQTITLVDWVNMRFIWEYAKHNVRIENKENIGLNMRKFGTPREVAVETELTRIQSTLSISIWESRKSVRYGQNYIVASGAVCIFLLRPIFNDNDASNGDKDEIGLIVAWTIKSAIWLVISS